MTIRTLGFPAADAARGNAKKARARRILRGMDSLRCDPFTIATRPAVQGTVQERVTEGGATAVSAVVEVSLVSRFTPSTADTAVAPSVPLLLSLLNRVLFMRHPSFLRLGLLLVGFRRL